MFADRSTSSAHSQRLAMSEVGPFMVAFDPHSIESVALLEPNSQVLDLAALFGVDNDDRDSQVRRVLRIRGDDGAADVVIEGSLTMHSVDLDAFVDVPIAVRSALDALAVQSLFFIEDRFAFCLCMERLVALAKPLANQKEKADV